MVIQAGNLFDLSPEEKVLYLEALAEFLRVREAWESLASVRPQVEPHFRSVAERIVARLAQSPLTAHTATPQVVEALVAIAGVYFAPPHLDAEYLDRRARAGQAYLEAGHTPSTLISGIYGLWLDEWSRTLAELFPHPEDQARLYRALALVSLYNAAIVLQQFTYAWEQRARVLEEELLQKFLRATGISRELYQQMAKTAEDQSI